jgi:hypothetical protein
MLRLAEAYEQITPVQSAVKQRYPHSHSIHRILANRHDERGRACDWNSKGPQRVIAMELQVVLDKTGKY